MLFNIYYFRANIYINILPSSLQEAPLCSVSMDLACLSWVSSVLPPPLALQSSLYFVSYCIITAMN